MKRLENKKSDYPSLGEFSHEVLKTLLTMYFYPIYLGVFAPGIYQVLYISSENH